jgi:signal peptidase I
VLARHDLAREDKLGPMMSNEPPGPGRGAGAQDAEELAGPPGRHGGHGYSAGSPWPADGPATEPAAGAESAGAEPAGAEPAGDGAGQGPASGPKRRKSAWRELPVLVVVALVIALVIKTFVIQPFFIPSSSMEDTLMIGDKVLVNKLVYHFRSIQPGDIIVFNGDGSWNPNPAPAKPGSNIFARAYDDTLRPLFHAVTGFFGTPVGQTDYIKRVIGVPGDRVECCNAQGLVTVNGVPLHEQSYLYPGAAPSQLKFNIVVPPGRLWVMGDNRQISDDSRMRMSDPGGGTIPENKVIGRAFVIVWPPSHWRFLPIPSTFSQAGISKGAAAGSAGSAGSAAAAVAARQAAAARLVGARAQPSRPYLPLAAGLVGAVPLTWLQRRARRRFVLRLRDRRPHRHS